MHRGTAASQARHRRRDRPLRNSSTICALRSVRAFNLFELEAKRAAWSAAYMLAFAVAAALLGVTAWLILIGALIVGAVAAGVHVGPGSRSLPLLCTPWRCSFCCVPSVAWSRT